MGWQPDFSSQVFFLDTAGSLVGSGGHLDSLKAVVEGLLLLGKEEGVFPFFAVEEGGQGTLLKKEGRDSSAIIVSAAGAPAAGCPASVEELLACAATMNEVASGQLREVVVISLLEDPSPRRGKLPSDVEVTFLALPGASQDQRLLHAGVEGARVVPAKPFEVDTLRACRQATGVAEALDRVLPSGAALGGRAHRM